MKFSLILFLLLSSISTIIGFNSLKFKSSTLRLHWSPHNTISLISTSTSTNNPISNSSPVSQFSDSFKDTTATSSPSPSNVATVVKFEKTVVDKGLTHIKYNKFAPSAEEAKDMSDEQFRATIYKRMKEDERERRKNGPIGAASSDEYEAFLTNGGKKK